jgi:metal-responsive CopG/Arc/MetJ family transcriptional regulator
MSDKNHTGQKMAQFWLDEELLIKLDKAIKKTGYINRAEWFREQVRNTIKESEKD